MRLCIVLAGLWSRRGYLTEGRSWLDRVLAADGAAPSMLRAEVLHAAGNLALFQGDYPRARDLLEQQVTLSRELGDKRNIGRGLSCLGTVWRGHGGGGKTPPPFFRGS